MWGKGNAPLLLLGGQTFTATVVFSQKIGIQSISRPQNTTLGHIPKGCRLLPQGHLLNCVQSNIIYNSPDPGNNLDAPQLKNE